MQRKKTGGKPVIRPEEAMAGGSGSGGKRETSRQILSQYVRTADYFGTVIDNEPLMRRTRFIEENPLASAADLGGENPAAMKKRFQALIEGIGDEYLIVKHTGMVLSLPADMRERVVFLMEKIGPKKPKSEFAPESGSPPVIYGRKEMLVAHIATRLEHLFLRKGRIGLETALDVLKKLAESGPFDKNGFDKAISMAIPGM